MFVRCKSCEKVYAGSMTDILEEGWGIITETTKEGYETVYLCPECKEAYDSIPELLDKGIEAFNKINTNEATKNIMLRNDILEKLTKLCTDLRLSVYISEECDDDKLDVLIYNRKSNEFVNRLIFDINKLKDGWESTTFNYLVNRMMDMGIITHYSDTSTKESL